MLVVVVVSRVAFIVVASSGVYGKTIFLTHFLKGFYACGNRTMVKTGSFAKD